MLVVAEGNRWVAKSRRRRRSSSNVHARSDRDRTRQSA
jgi:hypothetical protein